MLIGFFLIPAYTFICFVPDLLGQTAVVLRGQRFLTVEYYLLGLAFLLAMLNGTVLGSTRLGRVARPVELPTLSYNRYYLDFLAIATIAAYMIWFRNVLLNPIALWELLNSGLRVNRADHPTIGGVTTATQFGVAYVILFLTQFWNANSPALPRRFKWYFVLIIALSLFRVFAWSERLALLEVMIPVFLLYILYRVDAATAARRLLISAIPFIGILSLLAYFGITEYFRSWSAHYQYGDLSFWEFIVQRVTTYYYTSLNNGAGMLVVMEWPTWEFKYLAGWLHRFPFMIGNVFTFVIDVKPLQYEMYLSSHGDIEFNNPSGIFTTFWDVGIAGGLFVAAVIGAMAGYCYRSLRDRQGIGTLVYPVFFVMFLEIFRYLYIGHPRALPVIVALIGGYVFFREDRSRRHTSTLSPMAP